MDEKDFEKLKRLFEEFDGRPNHLAKFLIDSKALTSDFILKISESTAIMKSKETPYFKSISEMNNWYMHLVEDLDKLKREKTSEEIINELEGKLNKSIKSENFEEACRIRDYMIKNGYRSKQ